MKRKDGFFLNEMGSDYVVIAMDADAKSAFNGMLRLNASGAFLWSRLATETTIDKLAEALQKKYSIDLELAKTDCAEFLSTLRSANLLDE